MECTSLSEWDTIMGAASDKSGHLIYFHLNGETEMDLVFLLSYRLHLYFLLLYPHDSTGLSIHTINHSSSMLVVYEKSGRGWSPHELGLWPWACSSGRVKRMTTKLEEMVRKEAVCFQRGTAPISDVEWNVSPI